MKKKKKIVTDDGESYNERELAQLTRRRMIQKHHGDNTKFNRKAKHKRGYLDDLDEDF